MIRPFDVEVRFISPEITKELRHKVLWQHLENKEDCNIDIDQRDDAFHLSALYSGQIISIASFFEMKSDSLGYSRQYRLRAMATDENYRKRGAGRVILEKAISHLQGMNVEVLWCDAREEALEFYSKLGFDEIGEWYIVPSIGRHKLMYIEL